MVGEFSILIAIVILGGALIKILADMRSNADRQIKVAEEILKRVVSIHSDVHGMADPAKFSNLEMNIHLMRDHTNGLRSDVNDVQSAIKDMKEELKTAIRFAGSP